MVATAFRDISPYKFCKYWTYLIHIYRLPMGICNPFWRSHIQYCRCGFLLDEILPPSNFYSTESISFKMAFVHSTSKMATKAFNWLTTFSFNFYNTEQISFRRGLCRLHISWSLWEYAWFFVIIHPRWPPNASYWPKSFSPHFDHTKPISFKPSKCAYLMIPFTNMHDFSLSNIQDGHRTFWLADTLIFF